MGKTRKYFSAGETEVLHLRAHAKALVLPVGGLLVLAAVTGVVLAFHPESWPPWSGWVEAGLLALLFGWWVVAPFVRWLTTTYTFTDRRVIMRTGFVWQHGHDLPLNRVVNLEHRRGPIDRLFGCGTLVLTTAADEPVVLRGIPDVLRVHVLAFELLTNNDEPRSAPNSGSQPSDPGPRPAQGAR